jgi:hypothetical protein
MERLPGEKVFSCYVDIPSDIITINENFITINCIEVINKYYNWVISPDLLYFTIHKNFCGQTLVFCCIDGENIHISGLKEFISDLQAGLNLSKQQVVVQVYDPVEWPEVTVDVFSKSTIYNSMVAFIKPIKNDSFTKKFLALFGRYTFFRLKAAQHMHINYANDTILTYNDTTAGNKDLLNIKNFVQDEINWIKDIGETLLTQKLNTFGLGTGSLHWYDSMNDLEHYYDDYFIDFTLETDFYNGHWVTEKTGRSFALGKPFVLFGGAHTLKYIQDQGYKTFSPWINESYDNIINHVDRFNAVLSEIDRLANFSIEELRCMAVEMNDIFVHNQKTMVSNQSLLDTNRM